MGGGARIQTQVFWLQVPACNHSIILITPYMTLHSSNPSSHIAAEEAVPAVQDASSQGEVGPSQLRATFQETLDPVSRV